MPVHLPRRVVTLAAGALLAAGCADPVALADFDARVDASARRADLACVRVEASGTATLGFIPPDLPGGPALGALPGPVAIGGMTGLLHSVVTDLWTAGTNDRGADAEGATHITLRHFFAAGAHTFETEDRAVCAQVPGSPGTCRLSDQLTIVGGTGAFAGATGKLHNRGTIDFARGVLTYHLTGTVCGAGL
jgi:hypothetical protein